MINLIELKKKTNKQTTNKETNKQTRGKKGEKDEMLFFFMQAAVEFRVILNGQLHLNSTHPLWTI